MAIYWAELSNERDKARRRDLADRLRALAEREAVDPSWQAELRSLDPRLELERWGERWALGWAERPARAVAELVVSGLPAERPIDLGVRAAPLEVALREVQARTGVDLSKARARVGLGRGHLFELVVTIPRDVAGDEDALQIASELLVERALGLCVVDEWIGSVDVARSGHSRGLSVLGESRAAETHEIELLPELVERGVAGLRQGLPGSAAELARAGWTALEVAPERGEPQGDRLFVSTVAPEALKAALQGLPFRSGRFVRSPEIFCWFALPGAARDRRGAALRREEELVRLLGEQGSGALVGSGFGPRLDYLDVLAPRDEAALGRLVAWGRSAGSGGRFGFYDSAWEEETIEL